MAMKEKTGLEGKKPCHQRENPVAGLSPVRPKRGEGSVTTENSKQVSVVKAELKKVGGHQRVIINKVTTGAPL